MTDPPTDERSDGRHPDWFSAAATDDTSATDENGFSPDDAEWFDEIEPEDVDISMPDDTSPPAEDDSEAVVAGPDVPMATGDGSGTHTGTADTDAETSGPPTEPSSRSDADAEAADASDSTPESGTEGTNGAETSPTSTSTEDETTGREQSRDVPATDDPGKPCAATSDGAGVSDGSSTGREIASATARLEALFAWVRSVLPGGSN